MDGTRDLVKVYEIGNPNETDLKGNDWYAFLVYTQQAIMHAAPPPPEGMMYETTTGWRDSANRAYVLLVIRTKNCLGWMSSPRLRAVQEAFDKDGPLPEGIEVDTRFKIPPKDTPEYSVRMAYVGVMREELRKYEMKLRHVAMAVKGEWPGEEKGG